MNDDVINLIFDFAGNVHLDYCKLELIHAASMWQIRRRRDVIEYLCYARLRSGAFHSIKVVRYHLYRTQFHTKYTTPSGHHEYVLFWSE